MRLEIESAADLDAALLAGTSLRGAVFQGVDLTGHTSTLLEVDLAGALFLGCRLAPILADRLHAERALVFPSTKRVPYALYRRSLYTPEELFAGFDPGDASTYAAMHDERVYQHYVTTGRGLAADAFESLCRTLHDHAMCDAREEFVRDRTVVAVMGGHAMTRDEPGYAQVMELGRRLARLGVLVTTGGGPGAMEAAHLGAFSAQHDPADVEAAHAVLRGAPNFETREAWLAAGLRARARLSEAGEGTESLGIPTWFYGHEPPSPFPTHICKYFANAVREEGLLAIARAGVVFAPGSAGTIQEIFQDAAQNHYTTFGGPSPMVFLGRTYWTETKPVYPLVAKLAEGRPWGERLACVDTPEEAVAALGLPQ